LVIAKLPNRLPSLLVTWFGNLFFDGNQMPEKNIGMIAKERVE
jgi:hypothetical protein